MPLLDILYLVFGLLLLAMVSASISRKVALPYSVFLVIIGLLINLSETLFNQTWLIHDFHLTNELVLFVFLPALIFESALSLDARSLLKNLLPVLVLAIPGMFISMLLVGVGLWYSLSLNIYVALLFGALISATDPVAVVALFKELGVTRRLMTLVEGESLLNDATAIVLFHIILASALSAGLSVDDAIGIAPEFLRVFIGGIAVGAVIGLLFSEMMVRFYHGNDTITVVFSICLAYFSFFIAERELHVSGVMSVLASAICLNLVGLMRVSHETSHTVHSSWEVLLLICNSLLFILIGLSVDIFNLIGSWDSVLLAVAAVLLARAVSVYLFVPLTTRFFALPKVCLNEQHIMWWGGLKGGLAIAIVLSIPDQLPEKQLLIDLTVGVVMISLLLNATTIRHLIHCLKIDRLSNSEWAEYQQNRERVKLSVNDVLERFNQMKLLDNQLQNSLGAALENDLKQVRLDFSKVQRLEQVHLSALNAERSELEFLHEIGLMNYYTYVTFKDILNEDSERAIYVDDPNSHDINHQQITENVKHNRFIRIELFLIRLLSKFNGTLWLLVKYQERRFANRIQHDIAGILMAHEGLKEIKRNEAILGGDKLSKIKQIYQTRLQRRQKRLNGFKQMYPEFYQQYENFLFQRVSLKYSLILVNEEYEANKLTAKTYHQLQSCLAAGLKQLPRVRAMLQIKKADDWIRNVPLFAGLPEDYLEALSNKSEYVNYLPGDTLFNENDKGHSLYIVVSGCLCVFKINSQGVNEHINEVGEGSFVGEGALLNNSRRSATVRAKNYATLLRLTASEVIELSKVLPELCERLDERHLRIKID